MSGQRIMYSSQIPSSGIATSTLFEEGLEASCEPLQEEHYNGFSPFKLNSGPGGWRFKSSLPDRQFLPMSRVAHSNLPFRNLRAYPSFTFELDAWSMRYGVLTTIDNSRWGKTSNSLCGLSDTDRVPTYTFDSRDLL
jgi:hypothetical protein